MKSKGTPSPVKRISARLPSSCFVMKDLRGDSPSFRPGAPLQSPDSPKTRFRKFNPNRTFNVEKVASAPSFAPPISSAAPIEMQALQATLPSALNSMYHPPLHPLQYHLYAPPPVRVSLEAHQRTVDHLFIASDLRHELQQRNEATLQTMVSSSLPDYVHVYHSLVPLDSSVQGTTKKYKAVSNLNGRTVCLLRVSDFSVSHEQAMSPINKWNKVKLGGLVGVLEAFTTLAFGDNSLVVVYEYYPLAQTMESALNGSQPEGLVWSLAAQLGGTLHQLHKKGLFARNISTKTVLITSKDRARLSGCGCPDVMALEERIQSAADPPNPQDLMQRDWKDLGNVLQSMLGTRQYSQDLQAFLQLLQTPKVDQIMVALAPHILRVLDSALLYNDTLETTLSTELENARLVRLLSKLEFLARRPGQDDARWSPTGPLYPLLLLLDYTFHQVDENGKPTLDLAHAMSCLNKLDAGVDENVLLVSADEKTRLVVSYKELKALAESEFRQLRH